MGDATASPKPLLLGLAWLGGTMALASHFWLTQPKWAERLAVSSLLGVLPVLWFMRGMRRRSTHWRCLRCRNESPK